MRRTKVALVYKRTVDLRACQLLLGHSKLESTLRYLGIEVDDALVLTEQNRPLIVPSNPPNAAGSSRVGWIADIDFSP